MGLKASLENPAERRIETPSDIVKGIIKFDSKNDYPQQTNYLINASGVASSCIRLNAKYIRGRGFNDVFNSKIVNRFRQTIGVLLNKIARDYAKHRGFALHLNFNMLGQIIEVNHVKFEEVRLCIADDRGFVTQIKTHWDWDSKKSRMFDEKQIRTFDVFNPNKEFTIGRIIEEGLEKYAGQIYYYSEDPGMYPLSSIDPVKLDVDTDGRTKRFKNKNISKGFLQQHVLKKKGKFESDSAREDFLDTIRDFQGEEASNSIMLLEFDEDNLLELEPLESKLDDKIFAYTEDSTVKNIIQNFGIPPVLMGIQNNALGDSNSKYKEAKEFYDEFTLDERMNLTQVFSDIFSRFHEPINPSGDYTIIPQSGIQQEGEKKTLAERIGVGGITALQEILSNATIQPAQKINILIITFGVTKEEAEAMINGTPLPS